MRGHASPVVRHAISAASLTAITANLVFWCIPLALVQLLQFLLPASRPTARRLVERIYRRAVAFDSWWLMRVLGIRFQIHGKLPANPRQQMIVVSNHRSWFDIFVIQHVIVSKGPIVKFLIKRQLIFVPVVGWICLALDFPRLARSRAPDARSRDLQAIRNASHALQREPCALLNFAEGTRFSSAKRMAQASPFQHLLAPKTGGLSIMLNTLGDVDIVDVTLVYPRDDISFWQMLSGNVAMVEVDLYRTHAVDIDSPAERLQSRWELKENLIRTSPLRH